MVFENPHRKKSIKGDGFLTDLFSTSTKIAPAVLEQVKNNKDNLLSIIDESSKLKNNISKNIHVVKKINKFDEQIRSKGTEEKKKQKQQEEASKETATPKQQETHKTPKKEIINEIISRKKFL